MEKKKHNIQNEWGVHGAVWSELMFDKGQGMREGRASVRWIRRVSSQGHHLNSSVGLPGPPDLFLFLSQAPLG